MRSEAEKDNAPNHPDAYAERDGMIFVPKADWYFDIEARQNLKATIAQQAEAIRLLREALAPVDADAAERVSFWEDDWNPEYHVNVTLTVAECRAIRKALAATEPKEPGQ